MDLERPAFLALLVVLPFLFWVHWASGRKWAPGFGPALLSLRLITVLLVILALAGLRLPGPRPVATVFLWDVSDSVGRWQQEEIGSWVRQAVAAKGQDDLASIVFFAGSTETAVLVGSDEEVPPPPSSPDPKATDLVAALRQAASLFPTGFVKRVLLISDGNETEDNIFEEGEWLKADGIQVSAVPLATERLGPEVMLEEVRMPGYTRAGEQLSLYLRLYATTATDGTIQVWVDSRPAGNTVVTLQPGTNELTLKYSGLAQGFHSFRAEVAASADTRQENNNGWAFTIVGEEARVLMLTTLEEEGRYLREALEASAIAVDVRFPKELPLSPTFLEPYDGVVLVNLPSSTFSTEQLQLLQFYVQQMGGGLLVTGGNRSYTLGQYTDTPLEDLLPVSTVPPTEERATVTLVLVVDHSGSMGVYQKLERAKEAAAKAVEMLRAGDGVAVLAFDDETEWAVPLRTIRPEYEEEDRQAIVEGIASIGKGGGTRLFPPMVKAYRAIADVDTEVKHIILLTDGMDSYGWPPTTSKRPKELENRYYPFLANLVKDKVTISTIALGADADTELLEQIADRGGGRYYYVGDAAFVPQVVVEESKITTAEARVERSFRPQPVAGAEIPGGIAAEQFPLLNGYVRAKPKETAETLLVSDLNEALLVRWQQALGRVVAWTSDVGKSWASQWVQDPTFRPFWEQTVRWMLAALPTPNLAIQIDGREVSLRLEATDKKGQFINLAQVEALIVSPIGKGWRVPLFQTAPGRYEGRFTAEESGAHSVQLRQRAPNGEETVQAAGVVVSDGIEYRGRGTNHRLLASLAEQTGGRILQQPAEAFAPAEGERQMRSASSSLVTIALCLFVLDVALRRFQWSLSELWRHWWTERRAWGEIESQ